LREEEKAEYGQGHIFEQKSKLRFLFLNMLDKMSLFPKSSHNKVRKYENALIKDFVQTPFLENLGLGDWMKNLSDF
jgi:hypothetical protein